MEVGAIPRVLCGTSMIERKPKAKPGDVVVSEAAPRYWTVIAFDPERQTRRYLAVETDSQGRNPRGAPIWLTGFSRTGRKSRPPVRRFKRWLSEGGYEALGCQCLCCGPHYAGMEPDADDE